MAVTKPCADDKEFYADVNFCKSSRSMPGMRQYIYFIRRRNIVKWPTRKGNTATTLKEVPVLETDFTLEADKKWNKIELVANKQHLVAESIGQKPSKIFKTTYTAVVPGTEEEATGLAAELNNDDCVFLVPQRNGKFRCLGNQDYEADVAPGLDSGEGSEDANATTLTITIEDEIPAPFYAGKIETNSGDISGADGSVLPGPGA